MLSIPQKSGIDQRKNQLKKNLSALDLSRELRRQKEKEHTIAVGSRKKSFVVNAHSIENGARQHIDPVIEKCFGKGCCWSEQHFDTFFLAKSENAGERTFIRVVLEITTISDWGIKSRPLSSG